MVGGGEGFAALIRSFAPGEIVTGYAPSSNLQLESGKATMLSHERATR
jgi:hypothetical protein